jgi:lactate permease
VMIGNRSLSFKNGIIKDLAPFLLILAVLLLLNIVPFLKDLTFKQLIINLQFIPVHTIVLRPLFSAYLYLLLAFLLGAKLFHVNGQQMKEVLRTGSQKGWRASLATALFGAMGQIIAYSGYAPGFTELQQAVNIPWVMAHGLSEYTGSAFPAFVPLLGWVGTFLTGYGVASIMLFGQLQVQTAELMGISATWLASGLAVGASLGSISSPFKIAIAAPMCGALGQEGTILRLTIPLGVAASFLIGLVLWMIV